MNAHNLDEYDLLNYALLGAKKRLDRLDGLTFECKLNETGEVCGSLPGCEGCELLCRHEKTLEDYYEIKSSLKRILRDSPAFGEQGKGVVVPGG